MNKELHLITALEKDNEWFRLNFDKLQEDYEKKFIAIKKGKVIESRPNIKGLIHALECKREKPEFLLIKFMHEKGISVII